MGATATSGLLLFIRYGFMPNRLGYCGGPENERLFESAVTGRAGEGLAPILAKFTGAFPYLATIASATGIGDPFDARVVEAYWLGNELLERVEARQLSRSLEERFGAQLRGTTRELVLRKPVEGARPHHLFHVLDVYRRIEPEEIGMAAMESCRVSWGKVTSAEPGALVVERPPLVLADGRLELGPARAERVLRSIEGEGFVDEVHPGDWVSIHWGWACEVLDERKLGNLVRHTRHHLELANRTL